MQPLYLLIFAYVPCVAFVGTMTVTTRFLYQGGSLLLQQPIEPPLQAWARVVCPHTVHTVCVNRITQPHSLG